MEKTKNTRWIKLIMIVSQAVLFLFVTYWIVSQYQDEKEILKKELSYHFELSQDEAIDTIILNIFNPILNDDVDSTFYNIQISFEDDSLLNLEDPDSNSLTYNKIIMIDDSNCNAISTDTIKKIQKVEIITETSASISGFSEEEFFAKGVNLLIEMTSDSSSVTNTILELTDTSLLKRVFTKKLSDNNLNFNLNWTSQAQTDSTLIYFKSNFQDSSFGVIIKGFEIYLCKRIIPQILFALILLFLTGGAFWFTYKKLRQQIILNTIRKGFVSNISHELKTPVSTVKVALEAIKEFDLNTDQQKTREYLKMASLEMDRLDLLINQVMSTSLMDEGKHPFNPQTGDLRKLLKHIIKTMELRFLQSNAIVELSAEDNDYILNFDELLIQGVIVNLLDNSLRYNRITPKIQIRLEQTESKIKLSVSDNGIGIPEEYRNKVFEKFFRVPTGNKHNVKGSGLGLNYVKQIIDLHKGDISVKNNETGGCNFIIKLPKK